MLRRPAQRMDEETKQPMLLRKTSSKDKSAAELRLEKDFQELDLPPNVTHRFINDGDLKNFELVFDLKNEDQSYWKGGKYKFTVNVDNEYPHKPPKVHCNTPVYHPNIDTEGNVCLNILRADWSAVLGVTPVVLGLLFLFIDPNPNDPLNLNAAKVQRENIN